jgi:putative zinc finger/helix-turn-helix YgiT family protein
MTCFSCGTSKMKHGVATVKGAYRGRTYEVRTSAHVCPKCGYYLVEAVDTPELMRNLADAYRREAGLLTSDQIRAYRDSLGMSQQRFAEYLKVGAASVKRWELGAIQDAANDEHIRLKCDAEYAAENAATVKALQEGAADLRVFVSQLRMRRTGTIDVLQPETGAVEWPAFAETGFAHRA